MTREHVFFIPTIFFLGFVAGAIATHRRAAKGGEPGAAPARVSGRSVVIPMVALLVVFAATHLFSMHGGPQALTDALAGQPLFDQRPSPSAEEVYARMTAFGAAGRAAYQRMTLTADLVFPLVLFTFLLQLTRFVLGLARRLPTRVARLLLLVPATWFLADIAENAAIFYLLGEFPMRHDGLAGALGTITDLKFLLLLTSVAMPAGLMWIRTQSTRPRTELS